MRFLASKKRFFESTERMIFFFECFEQSQKRFFEVLILRGSKGVKIHFLFLGGFFFKKKGLIGKI